MSVDGTRDEWNARGVTSSRGARADEQPSVLGVGLDRYAGVTAAVAEGIPLADVLAQERIEEPAWPAADRAWKEALAEAPDLHLRYLKLRRQAEDCLSRRVDPLADDPEAWAGLLGEVALSDDPDRVLRSLGLRMTDMARLGRSWKKKAEEDPKVAERLTDLAGKAKAPRAVRCGPTTLQRFPWSPPPESPPKPRDKQPPIVAATEAPGAPEPSTSPPPREQLPSYLVTPPSPTLPVVPPPSFGAPSMAVSSFTAPSPVSPSAALPGLPSSPSPKPRRGATREMPMSSLPGAPTLPFMAGDPRNAGPPLEVARAPERPVLEAARADADTVDASADKSAPGLSPPAKVRVDTGTVDASATKPAPAPGPEGVIGGLTLAQYASLSAELGADPHNAPSILARYGVADDAARRKIADAWNEILLRDAAQRARWMQLTLEFRAWLSQQKRPA